MPTAIPYGDPGVASFASQDYGQADLLTGDMPMPTTNEDVAASTTLAVFSVVGRVGNLATGALTLATTGNVDPDDDIKPIGVLTQKVATGVGVTAKADVWRGGCFNPAALVWDSSFDTDAKKAKAFEGSPSPTNIVIRKPLYQDTLT